MPQARKHLVSIEDTPYYHIVSRCVRRTFLCGKDTKTGEDYEHRRQWLVDRIRILSSVFSIEILSYAVMSNHYHLVVKLDNSAPETWSMEEVIQRWLCVFKGPLIIQHYLKGKLSHPAELELVKEIADTWRERLGDLSWFMKLLNEPIARQANKEDNCTGHFWESRFRSDALLTEEALLTCMAYVDLNPIRAAMAQTPEDCDYTSIQERIKPAFNLNQALQNNTDVSTFHFARFSLKPLATFDGNIKSQQQNGIPFAFKDYLLLVDTTGRIQRNDKRGFIPATLEPILQRLNIQIDDWINNSQNFEKNYRSRFALNRHRPIAA